MSIDKNTGVMMFKTKLKYRENDYIGFNPFDGDREEVRCQTVKLVTVRKEHDCVLSAYGEIAYKIKAGQIARVEKAISEEGWCSCYCCIPCMDEWFKEIGLPEKDEGNDG